jgi:tetratricopeptide (TPR) repeat protein
VIAWLRREVARAPAAYAALAVVFVCFLAYSNSLRAGFHYDDAHHVVENPFLRDLRYVPHYFHRPDMFSALPGHDMYRPLVLATFAWNYHWGGYDPLAWRLTAIALHAFCAVGVLLTFRVLRRRLTPDAPESATLGGFVAALVFSIHPVLTETVDYASARSSLLAGALTLWAYFLHAKCEGARGPARALFRAGSLLAFVAALLSKEIAIVFPALLLAEALLRRRGYLEAVPPALVAALYLLARRQLLGAAVMDFAAHEASVARADPGSGGARPILHNLFTQARVVAAYFAMVLFPRGLCVDRYVRVSRSPFEPGVLLGGAAILALLLAAFRLRRRRPLASFGILWFFFALAPTSSVIPLNVVMNEHRLYLPCVGLALGFAPALLRLSRPVLGAAAVTLLALTLQRNADWSDPVRLWESAVRVSPESAGAWNSLGVQLSARGEHRSALDAFQRALALDPASWSAAFNLGTTNLRRGRETGERAFFDEAERWLRASLAIQPGATRSEWYLAEVHFELGRLDEAETAFRRLAATSPRLFEMTRYPLAHLALARGDHQAAEARYREALREGTDPVAARLGLARLAAALGRPEEARREARRAMQERPHDPEPHLFLARLDPGTPAALRHLFEAERRGYRPTPAEREAILARRRA